jgi:hypothetical protein
MGDLPPDIGVKLGRLLPMLSSPVADEVIATVAAIGRTLNQADMDWLDLAKRLTAPAQPQHRYHAPHPCKPPHADDVQEAMAAWLGKYRRHTLTDNQRDFLADVARMMMMGRTLSQAQVQYLRDLYHRNGGGDV